MPTHRKPKTPVKPTVMVTCPSCGRKGRTVNAKAPVRCSECGKEFIPGAGGIVRTIVLIVLALVIMAGIGYFAVTRASRLDAEEKAKAAIEERQRQSVVKGN
jgi:hypothetical protein